jgi:hypothetical protein
LIITGAALTTVGLFFLWGFWGLMQTVLFFVLGYYAGQIVADILHKD